ncbi:hypothetical protein NDK25_17520, partial [Niallia taxi]|nr:hypothetical protein [Niallia taxi]
MKEKIKSQLVRLVGLKFQYAGRTSNLFWLGIGDLVKINRRGRIEETAEYALHIQCSWRITLGNKIIVASRDFYSPNSQWDEKNEDFDWDIKGNNRFDERINTFIKDYGQIINVNINMYIFARLRMYKITCFLALNDPLNGRNFPPLSQLSHG